MKTKLSSMLIKQNLLFLRKKIVFKAMVVILVSQLNFSAELQNTLSKLQRATYGAIKNKNYFFKII